MTANPLLTESALPYHIPPFDKIKDEHFTPAYEQGMAEQLKEMDKIAADPEKPTFENTIVAMERSGELLARVDRIFSNLNAATRIRRCKRSRRTWRRNCPHIRTRSI